MSPSRIALARATVVGRRVLLLAAVALAAAALPGCGGGSSGGGGRGAETTTTVAGADDPAVPSAACAEGPVVAAGQTNGTLTVDAVERTYRLRVPPAHDGATPLPLVLDLHGLSVNADVEAAITSFEELGEREGVVVATPNGLGAVPFWNIVDSRLTPNDVTFLTALLDNLEASLCVDTSRVYAAGLSNGGLMATHLACQAPGRIAAVLAVAGELAPGANCAADPVPVMAVHGTDDQVVSFEGGLGPGVSGFLTSTDLLGLPGALQAQQEFAQAIDAALLPVPDVMAAWATHDGCDPEPEVTAISPEVELQTWHRCDHGGQNRLYVVAGGGHNWPREAGALDEAWSGLITMVVGTTTDDIDATELGWDYLRSYHS